MIYQKALKQLNTAFPKLNLKKPTKRANVRPLIQQIQCPNMTSNDLAMLRNTQTCTKPLSKLAKIVSTWLKIIQNNQKARQQQQTKPINKDLVHNMEYLFQESQQITQDEDFVIFVQRNSDRLHENNTTNSGSIKDYKQIYICKQLQFYNTITKIVEQQYFRTLQQLTQKLNILQQLIQQTSQNLQYLDDFNSTIQGDELFVKKDNMFNRIINYNLIRSLSLIQTLDGIKNVLYYYQDNFTFSIVRSYYLLYMCKQDIKANTDQSDYLQQVKAFLCQKPEQIFIKLYNQHITQKIIEIHNIQQEFRTKKQMKQTLSLRQVQSTTQRIRKIKQLVAQNNSQMLNQQHFLHLFEEIQNLLVEVKKQLKLDPYNEQCLRNRAELIYCQNQTLKCFIQAGINQSKSNSIAIRESKSIHDRSITHSNQSRKFISVQNSRLSSKSIQQQQKYKQKLQNIVKVHQQNFRKSKMDHNIINQNQIQNQNQNQIQNQNQNQNQNINQNQNQVINQTLGIFISYPFNNNSQQVKNKIKNFVQNPKLYQTECRNYIEKVQAEFGDKLQDAINFKINQLNLLIQTGALIQPPPKQLYLLRLLGRNLTKSQISQQNIIKIYKPRLKLNVLKILSQKLIQMSYKNTKILDNTNEVKRYPENFRRFIQVRNSFLKVVNKNLDKVLGIANVVFRIQVEKDKIFDISNYETYQTFLKILLAQKEAKAYHLSFQDEKISSKSTVNFVNTKIYIPFLQSIKQILPAPYNQLNKVIQVLDQVQFFMAFVAETQRIIQKFIDIIDSERQKQVIQNIKAQLSKQLNSWLVQCPQYLKNKKSIFNYQTVESQIIKLEQIIKVCNNHRKSQIQNVVAIKMMNLINKKL